MLLFSSADFFQNQLFKKDSFRNTIRVSKGLDSVGPDLSPSCLQRLSADKKKSWLAREELRIRLDIYVNRQILTKCQILFDSKMKKICINLWRMKTVSQGFS